MKLTKRKAFNFLRSYFDVLNQLKTDKDKLDFLVSIINKQFLDEDPEKLNFIVNLCYESQRHQIENSVKGWERASNETLSTTSSTPSGTTPSTPKQEEEEEEEEKEEEKYRIEFDNFWNKYNKKIDKNKCLLKWKRLSKKEKLEIRKTLSKYLESTPEVKYRKNPLTYLNGKCWEDEIITETKKEEQSFILKNF